MPGILFASWQCCYVHSYAIFSKHSDSMLKSLWKIFKVSLLRFIMVAFLRFSHLKFFKEYFLWCTLVRHSVEPIVALHPSDSVTSDSLYGSGQVLMSLAWSAVVQLVIFFCPAVFVGLAKSNLLCFITVINLIFVFSLWCTD